MTFRQHAITLLLATLATVVVGLPVHAQTRYVVDGGVTYRETVRRVTEPVYETSYVDQGPTYREQLRTEYRETTQTVWVPETTYRTQTTYRRQGLFGPVVPVAQVVPVTQMK